MENCPKCGTIFTSDDTFCNNCGQKLRKAFEKKETKQNAFSYHNEYSRFSAFSQLGERHVIVEENQREETQVSKKPKLLKIYLYLNYCIGFITGIIGFFGVFSNILLGLSLLMLSALFILVNFYVESYNNRARHICLIFSIIVFVLGIFIMNIFVLLIGVFDLYVLGFNHENVSLFNESNPSYQN